MAEVGVARAGGDDQGVVREAKAVPELDDPCVRVDPGGLAQQHGRVALPAEDGAQRLRDVTRRQRAGRHLVEQRLEQVVVAPVNQRHRDPVAGLAQLAGSVQPGEAAADDDDAVRAWSR